MASTPENNLDNSVPSDKDIQKLPPYDGVEEEELMSDEEKEESSFLKDLYDQLDAIKTQIIAKTTEARTASVLLGSRRIAEQELENLRKEKDALETKIQQAHEKGGHIKKVYEDPSLNKKVEQPVSSGEKVDDAGSGVEDFTSRHKTDTSGEEVEEPSSEAVRVEALSTEKSSEDVPTPSAGESVAEAVPALDESPQEVVDEKTPTESSGGRYEQFDASRTVPEEDLVSVFEKAKKGEPLNQEELDIYAHNHEEVIQRFEDWQFDKREGVDLGSTKTQDQVEEPADGYSKEVTDVTGTVEKNRLQQIKRRLKGIGVEKLDANRQTKRRLQQEERDLRSERDSLKVAANEGGEEISPFTDVENVETEETAQESTQETTSQEEVVTPEAIEVSTQGNEEVVETSSDVMQEEVPELEETIPALQERLDQMSLDDVRALYHRARFMRGRIALGRSVEVGGKKESLWFTEGAQRLRLIQSSYEDRLAEYRRREVEVYLQEQGETLTPENIRGFVVTQQKEEQEKIDTLLSGRDRTKAEKIRRWVLKHSKARMVGGLGLTALTAVASALTPVLVPIRAVVSGAGTYVGVEALLEKTRLVGHKGLIDKIAKDLKGKSVDEIIQVIGEELNSQQIDKEYARLKMLQIEKGVNFKDLGSPNAVQALISQYHKNLAERMMNSTQEVDEDLLSAFFEEQSKITNESLTASFDAHEKERIDKMKRKVIAGAAAAGSAFIISQSLFDGPPDSADISSVESPSIQATPEPGDVDLPEVDIELPERLDVRVPITIDEDGEGMIRAIAQHLEGSGLDHEKAMKIGNAMYLEGLKEHAEVISNLRDLGVDTNSVIDLETKLTEAAVNKEEWITQMQELLGSQNISESNAHEYATQLFEDGRMWNLVHKGDTFYLNLGGLSPEDLQSKSVTDILEKIDYDSGQFEGSDSVGKTGYDLPTKATPEPISDGLSEYTTRVEKVDPLGVEKLPARKLFPPETLPGKASSGTIQPLPTEQLPVNPDLSSPTTLGPEAQNVASTSAVESYADTVGGLSQSQLESIIGVSNLDASRPLNVYVADSVLNLDGIENYEEYLVSNAERYPAVNRLIFEDAIEKLKERAVSPSGAYQNIISGISQMDASEKDALRLIIDRAVNRPGISNAGIERDTLKALSEYLRRLVVSE